VREFYGEILSVAKDDDMHIARVRTRSRFFPNLAAREFRVCTDKWNNGARRFGSTLLVDASGRTGTNRQLGAERSAAQRTVTAHLDGDGVPALDPFIGTVKVGRRNDRATGSYPSTNAEFLAAVEAFDVTQCKAALLMGEKLPKKVVSAIEARIRVLPAESAATARRKRVA
jgi:hypothetical protein